MKLFKSILFMILNIISVPLTVVMGAGIVWYCLPAIQTTVIGTALTSVLTDQAIFWIVLSSSIVNFLFYVLQKIFNRTFSAKGKNFFMHLNTWLLALVVIGLAITTFILAEVQVTTFELNVSRKIGIGVSFLLLFMTFLCSSKISKIVNRRIQSYETAKEMNVAGRGSIIFTNFLKLLEIFFPEVIVLLLICFCLSWNVAAYFIAILLSFVVPMLGNIECDLNTRAEINRRRELDGNRLADKVSHKVKGE